MGSLQQLQRKIKTVVCPYHEMLCSLHVLHQPEHHPKRLHWANALLQEMPASLVEGIHVIGRLTDSWLGLSFTARRGSFPSSLDGIRQLKTLPDAELIHMLLNGRISLGMILAWQQGILPGGGNSVSPPDEPARYLLQHLVAVRTELFTTLEIYERDYFRKEWEFIQPWVHTAAAQFQDYVSRSAEQALSSLHPRLQAAGGSITAQKAVTYHLENLCTNACSGQADYRTASLG